MKENFYKVDGCKSNKSLQKALQQNHAFCAHIGIQKQEEKKEEKQKEKTEVCPEDPILKKINIDQYRSIILNLIFFNRRSLFFQYWGLITFSISDQYQDPYHDQYLINIRINIGSISISVIVKNILVSSTLDLFVASRIYKFSIISKTVNR